MITTRSHGQRKITLKPKLTVANLPITGLRQGEERIATDALNPVVGQTVTGGGSKTAEVTWNGTAWKVT